MESLFPGKAPGDVISAKELEAAGLADLLDRASAGEDLRERADAADSLPARLMEVISCSYTSDGFCSFTCDGF